MSKISPDTCIVLSLCSYKQEVQKYFAYHIDTIVNLVLLVLTQKEK